MKIIILKFGEMVFMGSILEFFKWMESNTPDENRMYLLYAPESNAYALSNELEFISLLHSGLKDQMGKE